MTTSATQLADHASSSTKNRQTLWAFLALLGAVLLWGTSYAATKTAITHFSPMLLIWLRMVMASLILLPFWRKLPKPDYRPLTKFENRGIKLGHGVWDLVFKRV